MNQQYPIPHSIFVPITHHPVYTTRTTRKNAPQAHEKESAEERDDDNDIDLLSQSVHSLWNESQSETDHGKDTTSTKSKYSKKKRYHEHLRNNNYAIENLPPEPPKSFQMKHLSNINTILHLSITRGDWKRAQRAYRLAVAHPQVDLRDHWRMGVEILAHDGIQPNGSHNNDYSKLEGFLERLIITYPYYKHHKTTHTENATHFMPVLLEYQILRLQNALKRQNKEKVPREKRVKDTLDGIDRILTRLDELQILPPWVDESSIWWLRGNLNLWAMDLCVSIRDRVNSGKHRQEAKRIGQLLEAKGMEDVEHLLMVDQHDLEDSRVDISDENAEWEESDDVVNSDDDDDSLDEHPGGVNEDYGKQQVGRAKEESSQTQNISYEATRKVLDMVSDEEIAEEESEDSIEDETNADLGTYPDEGKGRHMHGGLGRAREGVDDNSDEARSLHSGDGYGELQEDGDHDMHDNQARESEQRETIKLTDAVHSSDG